MASMASILRACGLLTHQVHLSKAAAAQLPDHLVA